MCMWYQHVHPVCGHVMLHDPPGLLRCDRGRPEADRPHGCDDVVGGPRPGDAFLTPKPCDGSEKCGVAGCPVSAKGARWRCCVCRYKNRLVPFCLNCRRAICRHCRRDSGPKRKPGACDGGSGNAGGAAAGKHEPPPASEEDGKMEGSLDAVE